MKNIFTILAVAATLAISSFGQQSREITLDDLIPKGQQQNMGIQKLTVDEKEALRQHILALLNAACAHANRSTELPDRNRLPAQLLAIAQRGRYLAGYGAMGGGHSIKKNIGSGEYIILEDGSLWQVDPLDKIDASLWLSESQMSELTFAVAIINSWNRLNVSFRSVRGSYDVMLGLTKAGLK
jgi:hypothetical protein